MQLSSLRSLGSLVLLIVGIIILQFSFTNAFLSSSSILSSASKIIPPSIVLKKNTDDFVSLLWMSDNENNYDEKDKSQRLRDLGYSNDEIIRSSTRKLEPQKKEPQKVRVDMLNNNFDATSLTAIGFALIAFNFFVLANMDMGGLAGIVATIMNSF